MQGTNKPGKNKRQGDMKQGTMRQGQDTIKGTKQRA
jgi:hypothetical protein